MQVVADIPDQYFHCFSGGYRQVASSLAPFPTLIPLLYSDDAIFFFLLFLSFYRALSTPVIIVCATPSSLFLFDLPFLYFFLFLFASFSPRRSHPRFFAYPSCSFCSFSILSLCLIFLYFLDTEINIKYVLFNFKLV